ncbi:MAG: hypothetical protein WC964_00570 [Acholeplasmataceae bacterium]
MIKIKSKREIELMRKAGQILEEVDKSLRIQLKQELVRISLIKSHMMK